MATNKQLTARVKLNTTDAEKKLKRLSLAIDAINRAAGMQTNAYNAVNAALGKNSAKIKEAKRKTDEIAKSANKVSTNFKKSGSVVDSLYYKLKWLASSYLGVMGARAVTTASDTITSNENRLNNLPGGNPTLTAQTMDKVYGASMRSRSGYGDMLDNVSKTMTLAGGAFQGNVDNAIRFQEIMSKSYSIGGASAAEQASSMYQLVQALGAGVLQGDELRSVREGAPIAYKKIEEFAQGVYGAEESLKDLASQGKITSDMVVAAIMDAEEEINESFNNTKITFAQVGKMLGNIALKAFQPALQSLNKLLNGDSGQAIFNILGTTLTMLGQMVSFLFSIFAGFFNWCYDNWYWLQFVVYGVIAAIIVWFGIWAKQAIITGWQAFTSFLMGLTPLGWWIIAIAAIFAALVWLTGGFEEACGVILGVIMGAISVIWNAFVALCVFLIQRFLTPLTTAFDFFANLLANIFIDPIAGIIYAFESLGQAVLGILKTIAIAIDKIFGSNLAEAVSGWQDGLGGKADELAKKWGNGKGKQVNVTERLNEALSTVQGALSWDTKDAYNTGHDWGVSGANWLTDKLGNMTSGLFSYDNTLGNAYDQTAALEGIQGNTDDIKNSMDLRDDDLEFLRRVAEMEWRNEFTTAEIKVDMTNNNSISSERDWEGMLTYLSDALREEMVSVADGVHY